MWLLCCMITDVIYWWKFSLSVYSGPPDPIHGTALYQKVRNTAQVRHRLHLITVSITQVYQRGRHTFNSTLNHFDCFSLQEVARLLFTDTICTKTGISPLNLAPPTMGEQQTWCLADSDPVQHSEFIESKTIFKLVFSWKPWYNMSIVPFSSGMGSGTSHRSGMQGFGYSPGKQGTGESRSYDHLICTYTAHKSNWVHVCICASQRAAIPYWIRSRKLQRWLRALSFHQLNTRASVSTTTITGL